MIGLLFPEEGDVNVFIEKLNETIYGKFVHRWVLFFKIQIISLLVQQFKMMLHLH